MKKILIMAAVVSAVVFSSCGMGGRSVKTDLDSVAYAFGIDMGNYLKTIDSTMNPNLIAKGIIDAFKNQGISQDSARNILQEYFMIKLPLKQQRAEEDFLAGVPKNNINATVRESGLIYEVLEPGDENVRAAINDKVLVNYHGTLRDGSTFDQRDSASFLLAPRALVPGWLEAIPLLGQGGKARFWIPSELGYGPQGKRDMFGNPVIGPYETLIFEIELLEVTPAEETPEVK